MILDEIGYLPIDKTGADLLFEIISQRYERGSTILTNRVYKKWAEIFNNDFTPSIAIGSIMRDNARLGWIVRELRRRLRAEGAFFTAPREAQAIFFDLQPCKGIERCNASKMFGMKLCHDCRATLA